jgi:hypothetical protein
MYGTQTTRQVRRQAGRLLCVAHPAAKRLVPTYARAAPSMQRPATAWGRANYHRMQKRQAQHRVCTSCCAALVCAGVRAHAYPAHGAPPRARAPAARRSCGRPQSGSAAPGRAPSRRASAPPRAARSPVTGRGQGCFKGCWWQPVQMCWRPRQGQHARASCLAAWNTLDGCPRGRCLPGPPERADAGLSPSLTSQARARDMSACHRVTGACRDAHPIVPAGAHAWRACLPANTDGSCPSSRAEPAQGVQARTPAPAPPTPTPAAPFQASQGAHQERRRGGRPRSQQPRQAGQVVRVTVRHPDRRQLGHLRAGRRQCKVGCRVE